MERRTVPVLNSLVFVRDSGGRSSPNIDGEQFIWRDETGVAISCQPDSDGDTELVLADVEPSVEDGLTCIFDETMHFPSGWLVTETLPDVVIFRIGVRRPEVRLRIWTDGLRDTRIVWLVVD